MARFDARSGNLYVTELGRVASHYYVKHRSILVIEQQLKPSMQWSEVFHLIASCSEFETLQLREEEVPELETLHRKWCCVPVKGGAGTAPGKVQVLLQARLHPLSCTGLLTCACTTRESLLSCRPQAPAATARRPPLRLSHLPTP